MNDCGNLLPKPKLPTTATMHLKQHHLHFNYVGPSSSDSDIIPNITILSGIALHQIMLSVAPLIFESLVNNLMLIYSELNTLG